MYMSVGVMKDYKLKQASGLRVMIQGIEPRNKFFFLLNSQFPNEVLGGKEGYFIRTIRTIH